MVALEGNDRDDAHRKDPRGLQSRERLDPGALVAPGGVIFFLYDIGKKTNYIVLDIVNWSINL